MRAVVQTSYNGIDALEIREVAKPQPKPDEVRVKVRAASVHPDVWHVVCGRPFALRLMGAGLSKPKNSIPGTDMAGIVEAIGEKVTQFGMGDAVFGETIGNFQWTNGGAFAEYVTAPADSLAHKPENVSFEQAATVPTAGYIVLLNLQQAGNIHPKQQVLINGAGGGVGSLALQIAKARGAEVTGVDCANKMELMTQLGADHIIDYQKDDFTKQGIKYDMIFDIPGNHSFSKCRQALKQHGKYVLIGHEQFGSRGHRIWGVLPTFLGLTLRSVFDKQIPPFSSDLPSKKEIMATLYQLLSSGAISPIVDRTFPLEQTPSALRYLATGQAVGRIVITCPSDSFSSSDA